MTNSYTSTNTEEAPEQFMASRGELRSCHPGSDAFREFMGSDQSPRITKKARRCGAADYLPQRAAKAGEPFVGERLVIPANTYRVRNNDCTCRFRAYNVFVYLPGLGGKRGPDSVLAFEPKGNGSHEAAFHFKPRTSRSAQGFYFDPQYGRFWVGARPSLEEVHQEMSLRCAHIDTLPGVPTRDVERVKLCIVCGVDISIEATVNEIREQAGLSFDEGTESADEAFEERPSEIRLRKDAFELAELARAVEVIRAGFEDIMQILPRAVEHRREERVVEGVFGAATRKEDNGLGYDTITASGNHANTLYWIDNDGPVNKDGLILVDAGAEVDFLYTADVTRTLSVNGRFTEIQTRVYQAALDAREAVFARADELRTRFRDAHDMAMFVIATRLHEWGLLPVSTEESLPPVGQQRRRWTPHGASHHLGLDIYDRIQTCREMYQDMLLEPGMTFTIEPGLYFRADDEAIPAEYRGIDVRTEDDVVVNEDGSVTRISEDIPRTIDDVEAWIAGVQGR